MIWYTSIIITSKPGVWFSAPVFDMTQTCFLCSHGDTISAPLPSQGSKTCRRASMLLWMLSINSLAGKRDIVPSLLHLFSTRPSLSTWELGPSWKKHVCTTGRNSSGKTYSSGVTQAGRITRWLHEDGRLHHYRSLTLDRWQQMLWVECDIWLTTNINMSVVSVGNSSTTSSTYKHMHIHMYECTHHSLGVWFCVLHTGLCITSVFWIVRSCLAY